jgi:Holliday junction resolvase RusA-like endonuclease
LIVEFVLPGKPVPKGRPRITSIGVKPRAYTPAATRKYEDEIRLVAGFAMRDHDPIPGPVAVEITARVPIPKSMSKKKRAEIAEGDRLPVTKPDVDNYIKAALDAMNGVVFEDDNQVTDLSVSKRYSDTPELAVRVTSI